MDVFQWTVLVAVLGSVAVISDYSQSFARGASSVQNLGSILFGGIRRTLAIYLILVTLVYWVGESYASGFRIGLGVGIAPEVTLGHLIFPVFEWITLMILVIVLVASRFRHPRFAWVYPPYSQQLARVWRFRAKIWDRSEKRFKRFLERYLKELKEDRPHYRDAFLLLSQREDWIGATAKEVLLEVNRKSDPSP